MHLYQANSWVAGPRGGKFPAPIEDLLNHPENRLGIRIRTPYVPTLVKFTCPSLSLASGGLSTALAAYELFRHKKQIKKGSIHNDGID